jgi:hypothetical protein
MLLSRDAILNAQDTVTEDVSVPEWGGTVRVRSMTIAERMEFSRRATDGNTRHVGVWLLALLAVDEHGNRLFSEAEMTSVLDALEKKNAHAIESVVGAILKVNRIGGEQEVEDARKNS